MNPYQISQDPAWHRWVDGLVVMTIGIALGLVAAQLFMAYETAVSPASQQLQLQVPLEVPAGEVNAPSSSVRFEEV